MSAHGSLGQKAHSLNEAHLKNASCTENVRSIQQSGSVLQHLMQSTLDAGAPSSGRVRQGVVLWWRFRPVRPCSAFSFMAYRVYREWRNRIGLCRVSARFW